MFPSPLPLPRLPAASQVPQLRWGIIGPGGIADHFAHALRQHRRHRLQWQEPASRYEQLCHETSHFAWCIGQSLIDSPTHSPDQTIITLAAMDNVRQQTGVTFNEEQQP